MINNYHSLIKQPNRFYVTVLVEYKITHKPQKLIDIEEWIVDNQLFGCVSCESGLDIRPDIIFQKYEFSLPTNELATECALRFV